MQFIHVKRGERVKFLRLGLDEATLKPTVVYETQAGDVWTRPASEFFDGRFITVLEYDKLQSEMKVAEKTAVLRPSRKRD